MTEGLVVSVTTPLVSRPYVELTIGVMRAFGATVRDDDIHHLRVAPTGYRPNDYRVEPDASAASYFFAAAAITGGKVRVEGLGTDSNQGDLGFVDLLSQMGAEVEQGHDWTTVRGTGELHGITADMSNLSDTAQTLAVVAPFADSATTVRGIGFIRAKETDRVAAVVTELQRAGIDAVEEADGFTVHPGTPRSSIIETYDDHRMAMSFALLGLRVPGIRIADPGCVAKTFPGYFEVLELLRGSDGARSGSGEPV